MGRYIRAILFGDKMTVEEATEELRKNPPSVFPDDDPNEIHGVDCKCEDSCLEMKCDKCKYEVSASRIGECCGQAMRVW